MITLGTDTTEGFIRHRRMRWRGYEVDAPVVVRLRQNAQRPTSRVPVRTSGNALVYALPCGEIRVVEGDA